MGLAETRTEGGMMEGVDIGANKGVYSVLRRAVTEAQKVLGQESDHWAQCRGEQ